jgi:hypothetical protein
MNAASTTDRIILRKLSEMLSTKPEDLPKALERFKKEILEIEQSLR